MSSPAVIDDLLLYRLARLTAVAGGMVVRLCEGRFGITRREWRILAVLAEQGPLGSSQLAESAELDRTRTSRAVTSLVAKKLLQRRACSGDQRRAALSLSEAGRAVYDGLFPLVSQIHIDLLSALSAEEGVQLDAALVRLTLQAERMRRAADLPNAGRGRRGRATAGAQGSSADGMRATIVAARPAM
ncbi:MarR family winged helix-turn-helix transcriptional regulator [soil metagenome]